MNLSNIRRLAAVAISLLAASCLEPSATLVTGGSDDDASRERIRRMNLTVEQWQVEGEAWTAITPDPTSRQVAAYTYDHCRYLLGQTPALAQCATPQASGPLDACGRQVCASQILLCMTLTLSELATTVSPTILTTQLGDNAYRISPQDPESRAALEQQAQSHARAVLATVHGAYWGTDGFPLGCSDDRLRVAVGVNESVDGSTLPQSTGELLASTLVEGLQLGEAAAGRGAELAAGVAARDASAIVDRGRAARLSWFDVNLSRLLALQMQTGGVMDTPLAALPVESGTYAQDPFSPYHIDLRTTGIGSQPACEGDCNRALGLLRMSGASFARIVDDPAVTASGSGTSLRQLIRGPVSRRLAERLGRPELRGMNETALATEFDIAPNDLRRARTWMIQEAATLARPTGLRANIPALMPPAGGTSPSPEFRYDRTTMADPEPPPEMHYITAGRATGIWSAPLESIGESVEPPGRPERSYLFDYAHTIARRAIAEDRVGRATPEGRRTQGVLATLIQDAEARRAARVEVCSRSEYGSTDEWRIRVFGVPRNELRMVDGTTSLTCAVRGRVEAESCNISNAPAGTAVTGQLTDGGVPSYTAGWDRYVEWTFSEPTPVDGAQRPYWYMMRRRPDRARGPGGYDAIAGIPWAPVTTAGNKFACVTIPFDSESVEFSSRLFSLSSKLHAERECGDQDLDGPIPLEDEIISDGDPYEDSWAYHLGVAARTAQHSDDLGQRLLQAGLAYDREAQQGVSDLIQACGVGVNLGGAFNSDGEAGQIQLDELVDDTRTCTVDGDCADGYGCVGTACVSTAFMPVGRTRYELEELMDCLGLSDDSATIPEVALGRTELCAWHTGDRNILCEGAVAGNCPRPRESPTDDCMGNMPAGATPVVIDETLNLFGSISPTGEIISDLSGLTPPDCGTFRRLRNTSARGSIPTSEDLRAIVESGFFRFENVQNWARKIGWEGFPGDYSEVTVSRQPFVTTGYPFRDDPGRPIGTSTAWPCAPHDTIVCDASDTRSLFCTVANCTTNEGRAEINVRLGRAVTTIGVFAGIGLSNLRMPALFEGLDSFNAGSVPGGFSPRYDASGAEWQRGAGGDFGEESFSGAVYAPPSGSGTVWTSQSLSGWEAHVAGLSVDQPFGFLNFGSEFAGEDNERGAAIARALWGGMGPEPMYLASGPGRTFFCNTLIEDRWTSIGCEIDPSRIDDVENARAVVLRAISAGTETENTRYLNGRERSSAFYHLSHLFRERAFNVSTGLTSYARNSAHLFEKDVPPGVPGANIVRRDILDAVELMCEAAHSRAAYEIPLCDEPPPVNTPGDIGTIQSHMICVAGRLEMIAERQFAQHLPADVVRALRGEPDDIRPDAGVYGETVNDLRQVLRAQAAAPRDIGRQLDGAAEDIGFLERRLASINRERMVEWLRALGQVVSTLATCASGNFGASCGTVVAQLAIALNINALGIEQGDDDAEDALARFRLTMQERIDALTSLEERMRQGADSVQSVLSRLRRAQASGQSAAARAAFLGSDAAGRQYNANTAMRRLYNINLLRYREAQEAAVRSSIVARRAVEQRFGVDLSEETCTSLVEPPRMWADDICNATGVDYLNYATIRDPDAPEPTPESVRQMFVGDYVRRLEQYVQSYRFDRPYSSGDDTIVLSLRDDIIGVRGTCIAQADNLLGASSSLSTVFMPTATGGISAESLPAWTVPPGGCLSEPDPDTGTEMTRGCIDIAEILDVDAAGHAVPGVTGRNAPPQAYRVTFAPGSDVPGATTHFTPTAAWVQDVPLASGVYRLSWYASSSAEIAGASAVRLSAGETPTVFETLAPVASVPSAGWSRYFRFFGVDGDGTVVSVGVYPPQPMPVPLAPRSAEIAGLQLENVTATVGTRSWASLDQAAVDAEPTVFYPPLFVSTTMPGVGSFDDCLVSDSAGFTDAWRYGCEALCGGGFGADACAEGERPADFCFWEHSFNLTEAQLLARSGGFGGGFAFGNYNYRSGEIGVNVIGTGVRNCSGPESTACYGTGTIPFSIRHVGNSLEGDPFGYTVRTHEGDLETVFLFDGVIESGRALASERYITNPVSSADRALLQDNMRGELRGRPMPGYYTVRIWDAPGVDFRRIEDIQLLWNYRYFSRTGESTLDSCGP